MAGARLATGPAAFRARIEPECRSRHEWQCTLVNPCPRQVAQGDGDSPGRVRAGGRVISDARDQTTRKADTLAMLATPAIDVWVATASADGVPHLVPVSLAWVDERVVIAVAGSSATARNLASSGQARLAVGPTRDVVMMDAVLESVVDVAADDALARPTSLRPTGTHAVAQAMSSSCCGRSECRHGARRTRSRAAP